ncbi:MAG: tetratricopeptide repeat protein [Deltaproteobacteria bacterium]|nr:tetratricopeptide repeat protein [Deltaproteobacteria bacterium]
MLYPLMGHSFLCAVLVVIIFAVYYSSLSYAMYFDTPLNLTKTSLEGVFPWFSFGQFFNSTRYFTQYLFGINYAIAGLDPFGFRVTGLLFHAANAVLLYFFLYQLYRSLLDESKPSQARLWAFIGAFLFALNPAGLYAVVYIIQRYVLVSVFFALLTLNAFMKGLSSGLKWIYVSVACYFFSVHSKEHTIMLPVMLLFLVFLVRGWDRHFFKKLLLPFVLYALIAGHVVYLLKWVVGSVYEPNAGLAIGAMTDGENLGEASVLVDHGLMYFQSVYNQAWLFFRYLYLWLIPDVSRMALDLPLPFVSGFLVWPEMLGTPLLMCHAAFSLLLLYKRGRAGLAGFCLLFPVVMFATEFSTVRFHENFVLYRSYVWMLPLFGIVPLLVHDFAKKPLRRWAVWVVLVLYGTGLLVAVRDRLEPFKDGLALWQDVVEKIDLTDKTIPSSYRSAANYATALGNSGKIKQAITYYRMAAELNGGYVKSWDGLGAALAMDGQYQEAIRYLTQAITVAPGYKESYYNLGTTYSMLEKPAEAITYFKQAITLDPNYKEALYNLANTLLKMQNAEEAVKYYRQMLLADPDNLDGQHNLGIALAQTGKHNEAINLYNKVIGLNAGHAKAWYNMANSLAALKQYREALKAYEISLKLEPGHVYALHNAGLMLVYLGEQERAGSFFKQAVQIDPQFQPSLEIIKQINDHP